MKMNAKDRQSAIDTLNAILEFELAGVVRYTHYSLMVFGENRIPLVEMMKKQAAESLLHAQQAGQFVTSLGGHPSLKIGKLLETRRHDIRDILQESLDHERAAVELYYRLLDQVKDKSVSLEEYARNMIGQEELHIADVEKMVRQPGSLKPAV